MTQSQSISVTSIGLDIGKEVFHLVGFDAQGAVVLRRKIKRGVRA
jgi:transposase